MAPAYSTSFANPTPALTAAQAAAAPQRQNKKRKAPAHLFLEANRNLFSDHCALLPLDDPHVKELPR